MSTTIKAPVVLESGDRLTRAEFHRRYCARPDIRKAELVGGVAYVPSPTRIPQHGVPHGMVVGWLHTFVVRTPGVELSDNGTVLLDDDTEVQPDAMLFRTTEANSLFRLTDEGYGEGAPDLVVEIAASSASYDLHDKKEHYRRAGVPEYVVWRTIDQAIDWFRLQNGEYVRVEPDEHGIIESAVFPGLRLNVGAMLAGDRAGVVASLT